MRNIPTNSPTIHQHTVDSNAPSCNHSPPIPDSHDASLFPGSPGRRVFEVYFARQKMNPSVLFDRGEAPATAAAHHPPAPSPVLLACKRWISSGHCFPCHQQSSAFGPMGPVNKFIQTVSSSTCQSAWGHWGVLQSCSQPLPSHQASGAGTLTPEVLEI